MTFGKLRAVHLLWILFAIHFFVATFFVWLGCYYHGRAEALAKSRAETAIKEKKVKTRIETATDISDLRRDALVIFKIYQQQDETDALMMHNLDEISRNICSLPLGTAVLIGVTIHLLRKEQKKAVSS